MLFVTAQSFPVREWKDKNGEIKQELCNFSEVTVHVNKSLGFRPMWAIPVTTFKKTLVSMLLIAPNYPQLFCMFETDDYVRVDKVKYYENLKNGVHDIPLASDKMPDYRVEYCLNLDSIGQPKMVGSVEAVLDLFEGRQMLMDAINIFMFTAGDSIPSELNDVVIEYVKAFPSMDFSNMHETFVSAFGEDGNIEVRMRLFELWTIYKHTILPFVLWSFCSDTKILCDKKDVVLFNAAALEACKSTYHQLIRLENDFARWSYDDCSLEGYERLRKQVEDCVFDSEPLLTALYEGKKIGRNELCPCGSGKKFKKCHGRFL